MTTFLLLILAGAAAGLVGYLTGLASLVSYPALLLAIALCVAVSVGFATWIEPVLRRELGRRLTRSPNLLSAEFSTSAVKRWDRT